MSSAYPLSWPDGWKRTSEFHRRVFSGFRTTFVKARDDLFEVNASLAESGPLDGSAFRNLVNGRIADHANNREVLNFSAEDEPPGDLLVSSRVFRGESQCGEISDGSRLCGLGLF